MNVVWQPTLPRLTPEYSPPKQQQQASSTFVLSRFSIRFYSHNVLSLLALERSTMMMNEFISRLALDHQSSCPLSSSQRSFEIVIDRAKVPATCRRNRSHSLSELMFIDINKSEATNDDVGQDCSKMLQLDCQDKSRDQCHRLNSSLRNLRLAKDFLQDVDENHCLKDDKRNRMATPISIPWIDSSSSRNMLHQNKAPSSSSIRNHDPPTKIQTSKTRISSNRTVVIANGSQKRSAKLLQGEPQDKTPQ